MHQYLKYICFCILLIFLITISCETKKGEDKLSAFYTKNNKAALEYVGEFSKISSQITKLILKDSLPGISHNANDSIVSKKIRFLLNIPAITRNDSLRDRWYSSFYNLIQYNSQLDTDILNAANELFMFYEQNSLLKNFYRNIVIDTIVVNKEVMGRWVTLSEILKMKVERRLKLY
jgi:hypothetical protein